MEVGFTRRVDLGYTNTGGGPITNISLSPLTGPDADVFSIFNETCTGETLNPVQTSVITIDFEPPVAGSFTAQFDVISSAADSPETIILNGVGIVDAIFKDRFDGTLILSR